MLSFPSILRIGAIVVAGSAAIGLASSASAKVLAKVDGAEITDQDLSIAEQDIGSTLPQQLDESQRQTYVLDYLIDLKLVAKKAAADKMGDNPDFIRQMAYYKDKILMEGLLGKVAKDATTEDAIKKVYDDASKAQKPETEVHARHILVPTEEEAKAALKRVKAGEEFAKVATELSKDPGSEGGDLGWFTKDRMVPEFADAAFKLEPGQISEPVKSQFGWHVIKLEEKRQKSFPALETVRPQVERYVVQKSQGEFITKLRADAKIDRTEPAPAAAPAAPGASTTPAPATPAPAAPAPAGK
jgi:peptidyl-prolyl cis-trans isomerase C